MSTPLSVFGKFAHIQTIVKSGRGDLVARIPWFLNGTTSLSKLIKQMHITVQNNESIKLRYTICIHLFDNNIHFSSHHYGLDGNSGSKFAYWFNSIIHFKLPHHRDCHNVHTNG